MTDATEETGAGLKGVAAESAPIGSRQAAGPSRRPIRDAEPVSEPRCIQHAATRRRVEWGAILALKLLLAGVFLVAGVEKASDPRTFAEQIANYQLLSEWSGWGAALLPATEIAAAFVLLFGTRRWSRSATAVLMGMLMMFTLAIIQAWSRGINTDCGCFGQGSSPVGPLSVLRNSGLLLAGATLLWLTGAARSPTSRSSA